MADYNFNDINDAKKRVQEMRGKNREQSTANRSSDIAQLIIRQNSARDKALILSIFYILSNEEVDCEIVSALLSVLL